MIDVVFLLLIFFVWTASFQIVEQVLPSNLTAAAGSQAANDSQPPPPEADFDDVVIKVHWNANQESSGIYFVKMVAGGQTNIQKLMLVK